MSRKHPKIDTVIVYLQEGQMHYIRPDLWAGDVLLEIDFDLSFKYRHPRVSTLTWRANTQLPPQMHADRLLEIDAPVANGDLLVRRLTEKLQEQGYADAYARNRAEALRQSINFEYYYAHSPQWTRLDMSWPAGGTDHLHATAWKEVLTEYQNLLPAMPRRATSPSTDVLSDWERELLQSSDG